MGEHFQTLNFAFPDSQSFPAFVFISLEIFFIAFDVAKAFRLPIFDVCFRCDASAFAVVQMPETAVNEDDFFVSRQNDVWFADEFFSVQSKAEAETVND